MRNGSCFNFLLKVRKIPGELKGANLFFVEDAAYQKAAIQEMERLMIGEYIFSELRTNRLPSVLPFWHFPKSSPQQLVDTLRKHRLYLP
jgi:hypothetical protein